MSRKCINCGCERADYSIQKIKNNKQIRNYRCPECGEEWIC